MELLLNDANRWLEICPWLLPATTMFCFLLMGVVLYVKGYMKLKTALLIGGTLGVFAIGYIYAAEYLLKIGGLG